MKMPWEISAGARKQLEQEMSGPKKNRQFVVGSAAWLEVQRSGALDRRPPIPPVPASTAVFRVVPPADFRSPYFSRLVPLCEAQNWRCCYCGIHMELGRERMWTDQTWRATTGVGATIEHVVPRVAGGTNDWFNLAAACRLCNNARSAMKAERYLRFVMWKGRERAAKYANRLRGRIQSRVSPERRAAALVH
jgi:hypothetical protein